MMKGSPLEHVPHFEACFQALTGYDPMRWQVRLFKRMLAGDLPGACNLPTGLGKTSVIPIWLIALASQSRDGGRPPLPRRLVYIVNRRTVVDQASDVVKTMRQRLRNPQDARRVAYQETLVALKRTLQALAADANEEVLGVSTLRGELADNEEWKADPARPAILVGTIDMVGSKLLFSGYGDGRYLRAHHAGLIGQDVLIVHDEAHLTPAFSDLLRAVAQEQCLEVERNGSTDPIGRSIKIVELSATSRGDDEDTFALQPGDDNDQIVQDRLTAVKQLYLHPVREDRVVEEIVMCSRVHEVAGAKILIYVRSPEQARRVRSVLEESLGTGGEGRIALLTGTIRGHERDQLMRQPPPSAGARVIRHFLDGSKPDCSVYLVSTPAGEVGIDLDADHMVCDLTTLDAMIQRLGRVNRRGGKRLRAHVDVVGDASERDKLSDLDRATAATFDFLKQWEKQQADGIDASPGSMRRLVEALSADEREAAFSPRPEAPPLTDILLDAWSLTSVQEMPGRQEVARFLHGLTRDAPETFVAWRWEIDLLAKSEADESTLRDWFLACRVESRERVRDQTERVRSTLESLLKNHRKANPDADFHVVVLDERGGARWSRLSEIMEKDFVLAFRTVVLPVEAGGLDRNGMLDATAREPSDGFSLDVAETSARLDRRERWLCRRSADGERFERLDPGESSEHAPSGLREKERLPLEQPGEGNETTESLELVLFVSPRRSVLEDPETASFRQTLEEHNDAIAVQMSAIAERLHLPEPIRGALVTAVRWHDKGKDRPVWQRYARNDSSAKPLAKSDRYRHARALGGYRHEFGSLLDAMRDSEIENHRERDLVLHLIAAHHGWARPYFEPRSSDHLHTTAENEQAAVEVIQRFGRLQLRFGRWGLAWIESLLRCADIAASKAAVVAGPSSPEEQDGSA